MDTLNVDQLKTLLGLTSSRVKEIADALERNWLGQMICAAVGTALVYDIGGLSRLICTYFHQENCTPRSDAVVLIAIELYYFMKFGQFVTAFLECRKLLDSLLDAYTPALRIEHLLPLRDSLSFFEGYYSRSAFASWAPLRVAYFSLFLFVVSTGQAAALFLLFRGYGLSVTSILLGTASIVALVILYVAFWFSKRDHPHTTKLVFGSIVSIVIAFITFWHTAP